MRELLDEDIQRDVENSNKLRKETPYKGTFDIASKGTEGTLDAVSLALAVHGTAQLIKGGISLLNSGKVAEKTVTFNSMKPVENSFKVAAKAETTRVGRWMSQAEYDKMIETGKVQMSTNGNRTYVANPAGIDAFPSAPKGSIYVEFDVNANFVIKAGKEEWSQIPGPGSLTDRLNQKRGLPPIIDMPEAGNIKIVGGK